MRTGWPNTNKVTPGIKHTRRKALAKKADVVDTCIAHDDQSVVLFDGLGLQAGLAPSSKKGPVRLARARRTAAHAAMTMS